MLRARSLEDIVRDREAKVDARVLVVLDALES
jgi:hypothetical protein